MDGATYLHHPIFPWVQRVTPKRANAVEEPPDRPRPRRQTILPPISQIPTPAESLLTVKLLNIGWDLLRASIARMYIRALAGGIPPNPNAAWGRNFLARVP